MGEKNSTPKREKVRRLRFKINDPVNATDRGIVRPAKIVELTREENGFDYWLEFVDERGGAAGYDDNELTAR